MSKHTPGPWSTHPMASCGVWAVNGIHVAATGGDMADDADPDEQEANAKLIAAAPDLYVALQQILNEYVNVREWNNWDVDGDEAVIAARAALAKATE